MSTNKQDILYKLNNALERMEQKGFVETEGYKKLKMKRDAILDGVDYEIRDVTLECIAAVGALICSNNIWWGGRHYSNEELIKKIKRSVNDFRLKNMGGFDW